MSRNDNLPEGKRRELEFVVGVIREGFAKAITHRTQPRYRAGKLLKIILFGSYARGDWVDDPIGLYHSDYDLLVVVDHEDLTDIPSLGDTMVFPGCQPRANYVPGTRLPPREQALVGRAPIRLKIKSS